MATWVSPRYSPPRRRAAWPFVAGLLLVFVLAIAAAVVLWSGATLVGDSQALARVELQPFAGSLQSATARDPQGREIPLVRDGKRLTPRTQLTPGETVRVTVVVKRPAWIGWALGKSRTEHLTVHAPVAHVVDRWVTAAPGRALRVSFDRDVQAAAIGNAPRRAVNGRTLAIPAAAPAGSVEVAAAARSWERLGPPIPVSWFPPAHTAVALATPAPSAHVAATAPLRLTFSKPVSDALGSKLPTLHPAVAGRWQRADSHTIVFRPSGFGAPMGGKVALALPRPLAVATASGRGLTRTARIEWTVRPASTLRLQQLLAQLGYLPVDWTPSGADVAATPSAQARAAANPPSGTFNWRYPNTPPELKQLWRPGQPNEITRGAVMMFQDTHHLTVDSFAGPEVWHALLADTLAHKRRDQGYSYVFVHRSVPQRMNLWHDGRILVSSPGNTGVPAAPTQLGTFPVFEHIPSGTMSGNNPDGSHYNDPGIKWISYFHGGEALHAFPRASFGTPQSLGCVELPLDAAAKVWPYTPIGTLVTIEN